MLAPSDSEELDPELSEWELAASMALKSAELPMWAYKARAATYLKGHRGILDLDLDFPKEYLQGPALECYVWKTEVEDGTRVHAYADVDGRCFHLEWQAASERIQMQPVHNEGPCSTQACRACAAAARIATMCGDAGD